MTINNFKEFSLDLTEFSKKVKVNLVTVTKKVAFGTFRGVVKKTPVDKGIARSSWLIGINEIDISSTAFSKNEVFTPEQAQGKAFDQLNKLKDFKTPFGFIAISNNLPYIKRLEDGYSQQAPSGMVNLTIQEQVTKLKSVLK